MPRTKLRKRKTLRRKERRGKGPPELRRLASERRRALREAREMEALLKAKTELEKANERLAKAKAGLRRTGRTGKAYTAIKRGVAVVRTVSKGIDRQMTMLGKRYKGWYED